MPRGTDRSDEARHQGRLWTPKELRAGGLLANWYGAPIEVSPISAPSGGVAQWNDVSGRNNHATQGSAGFFPTYPASGLGAGTKAISADKGDALALTTAITYNSTTGLSGVAVMERDTNALVRTLLGGPTAGCLQFEWGTAHKLELVRQGQLLLAQSAAASTGAHIVGFDAISNVSSVFLDGTPTTNATDPAFTQTTPYIFYTDQNGAVERFTGTCGEIILTSTRLTTDQRQLVEGYLAWSWDRRIGSDLLRGLLPSSHPYKTRPPLIGN